MPSGTSVARPNADRLGRILRVALVVAALVLVVLGIVLGQLLLALVAVAPALATLAVRPLVRAVSRPTGEDETRTDEAESDFAHSADLVEHLLAGEPHRGAEVIDLGEALAAKAAWSGQDRRSRERDRNSIGTAVLGGGPAGLTAAYVLAQRGEPGTVFEADIQVGGISKTVVVDGFRFDLGGHRFFTKLAPVSHFWEEMMEGEFLTRPRLSRIFYNGKFFAYPLTAKDVVGRLGLWESFRCATSYLWAQRNRSRTAETFEDWVTQRFGRRLYDAFFRSYTQKLWGIPGSEIRSLWAAQRIKNFSLFQAALTIVGLRREHVTTLIEEFRYPRLGPGQMWETVASRIEESVPVQLQHRVTSVNHRDGAVHSIVVDNGDEEQWLTVDGVLTTLPLADLVLQLNPPAPPEVVEAARGLRYRDLCLVALMTTEDEPFPDNWIYLHDPETRAGRVQNYGAWSEGMVRPGTTCLGVEYFCFEGDEIWELPEDEAISLATDELARIGLIDPKLVFGGAKVRVPKAYPMYDAEYDRHLATIKDFLTGFSNLMTFGRNGLHRYNNQDHSMWTAVLATLNLLDGTGYDVWSVNTEQEYHEEGEAVEVALDAGDTIFGGSRTKVVPRAATS